MKAGLLALGIFALAAPVAAQTDHWVCAGQEFVTGEHTGTRVSEGRLTLEADAAEGTFLVKLPARPFDALLVSLNHERWPEAAKVRSEVRLRVEGAWSAWLNVGDYGADASLPRSAESPPSLGVEVKTDLVRSQRVASDAQLRLVLTRGREAPRVRRVAIDRWTRAHVAQAPGTTPSPAWGRVIDVPQRSQCVEDPSIASRICSPTSLSMVMAHWGVVLPSASVASSVFDRAGDVYGNWSFNVAFASTQGLVATATHLDGLEELEAEIAAGRPVVISHRYADGELPGSPIRGTDGHLIVVVGFTETGDVVVNDPAANPRKGQSIRRTYGRAAVHRSWQLNAKGIAYVVRAYWH